jgi:hypothetical protein
MMNVVLGRIDKRSRVKKYGCSWPTNGDDISTSCSNLALNLFLAISTSSVA